MDKNSCVSYNTHFLFNAGKTISFILCAGCIASFGLPSFSTEYNIYSFNDLKNNKPYADGSILNINADITAEENIGSLGSVTINGNGHGFNPSAVNIVGFTPQAGETLSINNIGKYELIEVSKGTADSIAKFVSGEIRYFTLNTTNNGFSGFDFNIPDYDHTDYDGIFQNSGNLEIRNSVFKDNAVTYAANMQGNAINNKGGTVNIYDSIFVNQRSENVSDTVYGGVLSNIGTMNLVNSVVKDTYYHNVQYTAYGGAVYNEGAFNITGSSFVNNQLVTSLTDSQGGTIYNKGTMVISDSVFQDNRLVVENYHNMTSIANGGVISNKKNLTIDNTVFENNGMSSYGDVNGGVIENDSNSVLIINDSTFSNNNTDATEGIYGGVILNSGKALIINNTNFTKNIAKNINVVVGGVILLNTSAVLTDSSFIGNQSITNEGYGGAIENTEHLTIIAKDKDVVFSDNIISSDVSLSDAKSNAIDTSGTVNLNAGTKKIIFNDSITGSGVINVNQSGTWDSSANPQVPDGNYIPISAPTTGKIVLNSDMSGYTGSVNLYGGSIKLGTGSYTSMYEALNPSLSTTNPTLFTNASQVNTFDNAKIDLRNSRIDNKTNTTFVNTLNLNGNLNLGIDADLAAGISDYLEAGTVTGTGAVTISDVNILTDLASGSSFVKTLVAGTNLKNYVDLAADVNITKEAGVTNSYLLTYDKLDGYLTFNEDKPSLKKAVNATESDRLYSMAENEIVKESLGLMGGTDATLSINANGFDITAQNPGIMGIEAGEGQKLNISNVGTFNLTEVSEGTAGAFAKFDSEGNLKYYTLTHSDGWNNFGKEINNGYIMGSILEVEDTTTTSNSVFSNNGGLEMSDEDDFVEGGAIYAYNCNLVISDSVFSENNAAQAGAIYSTVANLTISNSIFSNNKVTTIDYGEAGAIRANKSTLNIINSVFSNNSASSIENAGAGGGAFSAYDSTLNIANSVFADNSAVNESGDSYVYGGAIYTYMSDSNITNTVFSNNSVVNENENSYVFGGAIYVDKSNFNIIDTVFSDNSAIGPNAFGGAIYVERGTLSIIADKKDVVFQGNYTADGVNSDGTLINKQSSAIHNDNSTINFNAGVNKIIFNDKITGEGFDEEININKTYEYTDSNGNVKNAPNYGIVEFNNAVTGNNVNVFGGTLKIGAYEENGTKKSSFPDKTVTMHNNTTLDTRNNLIENSGNVVINGSDNFNFKADANLAAEKSDSLNVTHTGSGNATITMGALNFIDDLDSADNEVILQILNNAVEGVSLVNNGTVNATSTNLYYFDDTYVSDTSIKIYRENLTGDADILGEMLAMTGNRNLLLTEDYNFNNNAKSPKLPQPMQDGTFTLNGNGYVINAYDPEKDKKVQIFNTDSGDKLTVSNTTIKNAYTNDSGAVLTNNGAEVTFQDVNFIDNTARVSGGAIYSSAGIVNISAQNADILFSNNIAAGTANDINITNDSTINLTTAKDRSISFKGGGIKGEISTFINKSGDGTVIFENADNSGFLGTYSQTGGKTQIITSEGGISKFFGGSTVFENGILEILGDVDGKSDKIVMGENTTLIVKSANFNPYQAVFKPGSTLIYDDLSDNSDYKEEVILNPDSGMGTLVNTSINPINFQKEVSASNDSKVYIDSKETVTFEKTLTVDSSKVVVKSSAQNSLITFNEKVSVTNSSEVSLFGTSKFNDDLYINRARISFLNPGEGFEVNGNMTIGSTLNEMNGVITQNKIIGDIIIGESQNADFWVDFDPVNKKSDSFKTSTIKLNDTILSGNVEISNYNLTSDFLGGEIIFKVFDANNIEEGVTFKQKDTLISTAVVRYALKSLGGGNYKLGSLGINPQAYRGQASVIASWQNQLVVNDMLFSHMEYVTNDILADSGANLYANENPLFAPYQYSKKDGGLWYKAFGNFETLSMTQGLNVHNNAYGSLVGADFPMVNLKNGWKVIPTAYIGYTGAHQTFEGVSMYQNGGQGGVMGTFFKGDFITSLLAYGGGYSNQMSVQNANDRTGNWFAGIASKSAYNIKLPKDFILQPTALVSYNIFGEQNYHSNFGNIGMNSGMLNGINVAPGFNLIWAKKTFSLYGTVQYVYNIMGDVSGQAGNIRLEDIQMRHGYIAYGIGAVKKIKDRLSAYGQVTLRNGGRTGVGFQLGVLWRL